MDKRELIIATITDSVSDLLYYNRKEDEELPKGAIEEAIKNGEISTEEMAMVFRAELDKTLGS